MNTHYIAFGGLLYIGIVAAGALAPRLLKWNEGLEGAPYMIRKLFWVYGGYVVFTVLCLGLLTTLYAEELAAGGPLVRAIAIYATGFWAIRLGVGIFVFKIEPYLDTWLKRVGFCVLNGAFAYLVVLYAWIAIVA